MASWREMSYYRYDQPRTLQQRLEFENDQDLPWLDEYKFTEDESGWDDWD